MQYGVHYSEYHYQAGITWTGTFKKKRNQGKIYTLSIQKGGAEQE